MVNRQLQNPSALTVPNQTHLSGRTLALARAVIKSKPKHSSLQGICTSIPSNFLPADVKSAEFLSQIHQIIVRGRNANDDRERRLDSAAFWHQAYEKSEAARSSLLDKIYEFEQRLEASNSSNGWEGVVTRKRAREEAHLPLENKSNKRQETGSGTGPGYSTAHTDTAEPETYDPAISALRHLYHVRTLLVAEEPEPESLASACIGLCRAASSAISASLNLLQDIPDAKRRYVTSRTSIGGTALTGERNMIDQSTFFTVVEGQCYAAILQGLKRLSTLGDSRRNQSKVIHGLITLFQGVLAGLHANFLQHSKELVEAEKESRTKRAGTRGRNTTKNAGNTVEEWDPQTPKIISRLLCSMILNLDVTRPESSSLLEGYLGCLLEHIGSRLCFVVFGEEHVRADSVFKKVAHQPQPVGLGDQLHNEIKRRAVEGETQFLTTVLRQALQFAGTQQHLLSEEVEGRDHDRDPQRTWHVLLKSRLQKTLLKGVFGNDDLFEDSLRKHNTEICDSDSEDAEVKERAAEEPGSRFIREIWELVGWDILEDAITSAKIDEEL